MKRVRRIARISPTHPRQRGFTLIELIVVIAIIGILASIALMVGNRVVISGRVDLTRTLIRILDQTQDSYMQDRDGKIPFKWTDTSAQRNEFGIVDGRITPVTGTNDVIEPSVVFYGLATGESTSVQSTMKGLDSRYVVRAPISNAAPTGTYDPTNFTTIYTKQNVSPQTLIAGEQVFGLVIKDPWGNAIRYVHPKFHGGYGAYSVSGNAATLGAPARDNEFNASGTFKLKQNNADYALKFRRSYRPDNTGQTGDADEGLCTGARGYFYSPGPDKDAGTRGDNVYLDAKPQFPPENAKFE